MQGVARVVTDAQRGHLSSGRQCVVGEKAAWTRGVLASSCFIWPASATGLRSGFFMRNAPSHSWARGRKCKGFHARGTNCERLAPVCGLECSPLYDGGGYGRCELHRQRTEEARLLPEKIIRFTPPRMFAHGGSGTLGQLIDGWNRFLLLWAWRAR